MVYDDAVNDGLFVNTRHQYVQPCWYDGSNLRNSVLIYRKKIQPLMATMYIWSFRITMDIQNTNIVSNQAGKHNGGDDTNINYIIICRYDVKMN